MLTPVETVAVPDIRSDAMLISAARAQTLKLANQRAAALPHAPVLIEGGEPFALDLARAVADPALDMANPMKGPFRALALPDGAWPATALEIARQAGILPAFLVDAVPEEEPVQVATRDLEAFAAPESLRIAARTRLPISVAEQADIAIFRSPADLREHAAITIGRQSADRVPLVRIHSECLTGDVFGSLKCDCGPQLDHALAASAREAEHGGYGIVLYLRQEGRGIGLVNKLRAYQLQEQGYDTVEANQRLGLPDESRDFPIAGRMLSLLGISRIRLLTNNPAKLTALEGQGIEIVERVPLDTGTNPHNARYLATKRDRSGHLL
ncbi:GTP cyclohydrolase II [Alteriqipengyuania lutimaris]|nr:GTP cyclohydrolase II [Alteriqipengyuania lutimaris]MBB3034169.1 GTP cyclohydrolase II [Alteriqipengyuania lutimaris]